MKFLFNKITSKRYFLTLLLFIFINYLFIEKYLSRLNVIPSIVFFGIYIIGIFIIFYVFKKFNVFQKKYIFWVSCLIIFIATIFINNYVDGFKLNTDRWSSTHFAIKALLNGNYPYFATDHLNGRTSNLPFLIFINIPFYFLGDVGYLQSFTLLIFFYFLNIYIDNIKLKIFSLILLVTSLPFWWEIYCKSDILSNSILLIITTFYLFHYKKNKTNIFFVGIIFSFMIMTRLVSLIPFFLAFSTHFFTMNIRKKISFILIVMLIISISFGIVFMNAKNIEMIKHYNPFELQNRQIPFYLSLIFIIVPIIYSFFIKNIKALIYNCIFFLSIPILTSFLWRVIIHGWNNSLYNSYTDISYFNLLLPFIVFILAYDFKSILDNK